MGVIRVSDNVYSVGVINPSLRIFDIIMEAKYGTSYNAYFINDRKITLVDTVHEDYFDEYIYNVGQLADLTEIEYLIVNHTELDHSGSIKKLLQACPNITIVCTVPAKKYLTAILNEDFKCITVKHGEELDLGQTVLKFIVAPLLHWPDTMMTYHPDDEVLFSCDFLGCHFCEPELFDNKTHYTKEYLAEFEYYYQGIFSPFKPFVLDGLNKIKDFKISFIAPSHGPVLVDGIKDRIEDYKRWSTPQEVEQTVAILYASAYGCTKKLALKAMQILNEQGIKAEVLDVVTEDIANCAGKIANSSAVMVGACTINRDAPSVIWQVLSHIDAINVKKKPAVAFGSYGWSGEAPAMVAQRLTQLGFNVVSEPVKVNFMPSELEYDQIVAAANELASKLK